MSIELGIILPLGILSAFYILDSTITKIKYKAREIDIKRRKSKVIFEKHQIYTEPGSTEQLKCLNCGDSSFYVGQDHYLTVVKCTNCLSEEVVHDG